MLLSFQFSLLRSVIGICMKTTLIDINFTDSHGLKKKN